MDKSTSWGPSYFFRHGSTTSCCTFIQCCFVFPYLAGFLSSPLYRLLLVPRFCCSISSYVYILGWSWKWVTGPKPVCILYIYSSKGLIAFLPALFGNFQHDLSMKFHLTAEFPWFFNWNIHAHQFSNQPWCAFCSQFVFYRVACRFQEPPGSWEDHHRRSAHGDARRRYLSA